MPLLASTILPVLAYAGYPVKRPCIPVHRPTILAFSPRIEQGDLKRDPDLNESISDFQLYANQVRKLLAKAGIEFKEVHADSFCIKVQTVTVSVNRLDGNIGYYFVQPGKEPHVEYGVRTTDDIEREARAYFGIVVK